MPGSKVYVAPDESSPHGQAKVDAMSAKLEEAKTAGNVARWRISGLCGGLGSALMTFLVISLFLFRVGSNPAYFAATIGFYGLPGMLLALLPTDARPIYWVGRFLAVVSLLGTLSNTSQAIGGLVLLECRQSSTVDSWWCDLLQIQYVIWATTTSTTFILFLHAQWLSPRASLNRMWQTTGLFISVFGSLAVVVTGIEVVAKPTDEIRMRVVCWQIARNLSWLVIGVMHASPKFRTTIHSALLARGGQIASASAIAALMGGRSPEDVREIAGKNFKGVTLGPGGITYQHLADRAPNPDELSALSRACKFGGVDYFVSHSWRDDLEAKWDILQKIRANFMKKHGRECVVWLDK